MVVTDKSGITASATPGMTRQWVVKAYPPQNGPMSLDDTFELRTAPLWGDAGNSAAGGGAAGKILVKVTTLSNDPAQRTWIVDKDERDHYTKPVRPGDVMKSMAIGEVVESWHPDYAAGDLVSGVFGWTEYSLVAVPEAGTAAAAWRPRVLPPKTDPTDFMAVGMNGLTAYFGLLATGAATAKDKVIVVSGAAGSTGSLVLQIAKKVLGVAKVYGIAGGPEKCAMVEGLGADRCFDYKQAGWEKEFRDVVWHQDGGIDCYFDNVGGKILDLCLHCMNHKGRISCCGAIAGYENHSAGDVSGAAWQNIIFKKLRVEGFIVSEFAEQFGKGTADLQQWVMEGKIKPIKTIYKAKFEDVPQGMAKVLGGHNQGKLITQLID